MSNTAKIWLIVASALTLLGIIICVGVMAAVGWDFTKLSTVQYVKNDYEIDFDFDDISINSDTADVRILVSDDEKCKVECYESKNSTHTVSVKDGKLEIALNSNKLWYEYIGIDFGSPKINVYLPKLEYDALNIKSSTSDVEVAKELIFENIEISVTTGDVNCFASAKENVKIKTSTGDIFAESVSAKNIDFVVTTGKINATDIICEEDVCITVSTGKTYITNGKCQSLKSYGNTGDITLNNVIATEKITIERSTGKVKFDGCDAGELLVHTDTGDVSGSLLSEKIFIVRTDTGKISVPASVSGGRCEITTDTGDIKINLH